MRRGILIGLVGLAGACTCGPPANDVVVVETTLVPPAAMVDAAWPVKMATQQDFAEYADNAAWVALVMQRNVRDVTPVLGAQGGAAAARAHVEAALMYRQAALLAAHAILETFGKTPDPTDPAGVAHLLSVSHAIVGDREAARAASLALPVGDPTALWHEPWKQWLAGPAVWPPDLAALPLGLPPPTPGGWPAGAPTPHYKLQERVAGGIERELGDPGALVALGLWHDATARVVMPELSGELDAFSAGYRYPVEPPSPGAPLSMPMLFGSDLMVPQDGPFLSAVYGPEGKGAVDTWKDKSVIAWLAFSSRGASGGIDASIAADRVASLRDALLAASAARTGGNTESHHRVFSDIALAGSLRALALVAEVEGDREVSGLLRINAWEHSQKATAWPVGLLALAAWDASNRYPSRALDILHAQIRRFPELDPARYALDALALRVGRERPGETPGI